jgi:putative toxin-antitoxin system antitoxin component (TIGR02293 family)
VAASDQRDSVAAGGDGNAQMTVIDEVMRMNLVDTVDVAQVLGTSPRSVARWQQGETSPRRESVDRLLELKAVLDLASKVMRPDSARLWLRSPVPDLDYNKPLDLVENGQFRKVVTSLTALAEGLTA